MEYLLPIGGYLIPIAAIVLLFLVFYWDDIAIGVRLLRRLFKRLLN